MLEKENSSQLTSKKDFGQPLKYSEQSSHTLPSF